CDPGDRDARANRAAEDPVAVNDEPRPRQVGRRAEVLGPQILDATLAEHLSEDLDAAAAADERHDRQRPVAERIVAEPEPVELEHGGGVETARELRRDDGSHAGSADPV